MAGAEKLKEKILSDARRTADSNLALAHREADEIVLKAREEARALHSALTAKAGREADAREKRLISVAELEGRKERLAVKQRLIEELFTAAVQSLCDKPDREYEALLVDMISGAASGGEEIIISEKDSGRLTQNFVGFVNEALKKKGKPGTLTLSAETRRIEGGFALRSGNTEVNNSFASVVRSKKDSLEALAVKMLF